MRCNNCFQVYDGGAVCPKCGYEQGRPGDELFYLFPGTVLSQRYIVGKVIGEGGFGIVYKSWDNVNRAMVAVKEYYPRGLVSRTPGVKHVRLAAQKHANEFEFGRQRFVAESNVTITIGNKYMYNPNLLHGFASFDENGTSYLVMELLEGVTLTERVEASGAMPVDDGVGMMYAVLGALKDIHSTGIIHRDISPDNIILCNDGTVKLFDFGAAKFGKKDKSNNAERVLKPGYSPPEQYEPGDRTDVYTDIYAAGATLYYALTGIKPEESTNRKEGDLLATPLSLNPLIPAHVSDAIRRAMAIDLRIRFKSADEFARALRGAFKFLPPEKEIRKRKLRRVLTVGVTLIILGFAATLTYNQLREQVPTLNDATIEVWFVLSGDDLTDSQSTAALERIIWEFNEIFPNVIVDLRGVAANDYESEVETAVGRGLPVLFESGGVSRALLAGTEDLTSVANRARRDAYFLDGYTRLFPDRNQMPTGFVVSCVFINTAQSTYDGEGVSDLTALFASMPQGGAISVYSGLEGDFVAAFGNVPHSTQQEFFRDEVGALFADTSALREVQARFAGRYRLLRVDRPVVPVAFGGLYSIAGGDRDELAALSRFLEFMFSENSQDALHIQASSGLAPLNRVALETYQGVFIDFEEFFENMDQYVFSSH